MLARRKSGFTLIELLVVIAIIAILAAILFPVFARARETARKSNCTNNMKECAVAIQVYWNDFDSMLPASNAADATSATNFITGNGAFPLPPATNAVRVSWAQKVYDYMKSKEIMFCPSDGNKETYPNANGLSYWWKSAVNDAWWGTGTCRKESDYVYGSDQIILYERAGFHSGETGLRAGTQINVAYLDSHVRNVALKDTGGLTAPTGVFNGGEPMYFNWNFTTDTAVAIGKNADPRNQGDKM